MTTIIPGMSGYEQSDTPLQRPERVTYMTTFPSCVRPQFSRSTHNRRVDQRLIRGNFGLDSLYADRATAEVIEVIAGHDPEHAEEIAASAAFSDPRYRATALLKIAAALAREGPARAQASQIP